jgi:hypothetical protein
MDATHLVPSETDLLREIERLKARSEVLVQQFRRTLRRYDGPWLCYRALVPDAAREVLTWPISGERMDARRGNGYYERVTEVAVRKASQGKAAPCGE